MEADRGGFTTNMLNAFVDQVPVEGMPELAAVVGFNSLDLEGQLRERVFDESGSDFLILPQIGVGHAQAGHSHRSGSIGSSPSSTGLRGFGELHTKLQCMVGPLLLVSLAAGLCAIFWKS